MLEQEIDKRLTTTEPGRREQQIGVPLAQGRIDEAARAARERRPVKRCGHRRGDHRPQRTAGVLGLAEHRLEQRVVRAGGHVAPA
jgi:hypothetical protein